MRGMFRPLPAKNRTDLFVANSLQKPACKALARLLVCQSQGKTAYPPKLRQFNPIRGESTGRLPGPTKTPTGFHSRRRKGLRVLLTGRSAPSEQRMPAPDSFLSLLASS